MKRIFILAASAVMLLFAASCSKEMTSIKERPSLSVNIDEGIGAGGFSGSRDGTSVSDFFVPNYGHVSASCILSAEYGYCVQYVLDVKVNGMVVMGTGNARKKDEAASIARERFYANLEAAAR